MTNEELRIREITQWRKDGKHLPEFMKDFHDQKVVFKMIHEYVTDDSNLLEKFSPMETHQYVIDFFLWYMARHGYTLQKNRTKLQFDDINETLEGYRKFSQERFNSILPKK